MQQINKQQQGQAPRKDGVYYADGFYTKDEIARDNLNLVIAIVLAPFTLGLSLFLHAWLCFFRL
ncbi:hypothetical protein ACE1B6_24410 [Aerosakkonemataceae cyanobacterium BLCC-F154]|uniref:Uncharacterized protein n=1 Tax=Floridaenema fluviatile BLCC-F154 TaxID=3153640 RepID=A0ABV4YHU2_9CYAN